MEQGFRQTNKAQVDLLAGGTVQLNHGHEQTLFGPGIRPGIERVGFGKGGQSIFDKPMGSKIPHIIGDYRFIA